MKEVFLNVGIMITDRRQIKLMEKDKDIEEEIREYTEKEQEFQTWKHEYLRQERMRKFMGDRAERERRVKESPEWEEHVKDVMERLGLERTDEQEDE
jgi:hypothetical protein|tara:strand:- start:599 stop:889 length:291 start_codon:yes stop_codon:yes gene_type:complete